MRRRRTYPAKVRTLEIPLPETPTSEGLLATRLGSERASDRAVLEVMAELGLPPAAPRSVLAAMALARLGEDLEAVARLLDWEDFEEFSAMVVAASGYRVKKNVRLRKPTRQIDLVAESPSLVLAIDCKHWRRGGTSALATAAEAQTERTKMLREKAGPNGKLHLPVLLTVLDSHVRVLGGVPVVPLQGLKEFLINVNPYDDALSFVAG